jgi:hypothetical protein
VKLYAQHGAAFSTRPIAASAHLVSTTLILVAASAAIAALWIAYQILWFGVASILGCSAFLVQVFIEIATALSKQSKKP